MKGKEIGKSGRKGRIGRRGYLIIAFGEFTCSPRGTVRAIPNVGDVKGAAAKRLPRIGRVMTGGGASGRGIITCEAGGALV